MNYSNYKNELAQFSKNASDDEVRDFIEINVKKYPHKTLSIIKASFAALKDDKPAISYAVTKEYINDIRDLKFLKVFKKRLNQYLDSGVIDEQEYKKIHKQLLLNDIVENFLEESQKDSFQAFENLDNKLEKYYYLKKTAVTRLLKRLDSGSDIYEKIKREYR